MKHTLISPFGILVIAVPAFADEPLEPVFNRAPLAEKTYAELPLGAIEPEG